MPVIAKSSSHEAVRLSIACMSLGVLTAIDCLCLRSCLGTIWTFLYTVVCVEDVVKVEQRLAPSRIRSTTVNHVASCGGLHYIAPSQYVDPTPFVAAVCTNFR